MAARRAPPRLARRAIRHGLILAILTGTAALAAVVALAQNGEPPLQQIRLVDPTYLAGAALLTLAAWWLRIWRSGLLAAAMGARIPLPRLFRYYLSSVFVSHVTPTSTGGVPLFVYLLTREGLSAGGAAAVAVIDSGLVGLWLVVVAPAAAVWLRLGRHSGPMGALPAVIVGVALAGIALALLLLRPKAPAAALWWLSRRPWMLRRIRRGRRLRRAVRALIRENLRFGRSMHFLVMDRPWMMVGATLLTGLYWAAYLSIAWAVLEGIGVRTGWLRVALLQLLFNLVQPFIPTPGGSGGAELLMAYLFRDLVHARRLPLFVGVWRLFTFYASLAVGGLLFARTLGTVAEMPAAAAPLREGRPDEHAEPQP